MLKLTPILGGLPEVIQIAKEKSMGKVLVKSLGEEDPIIFFFYFI